MSEEVAAWWQQAGEDLETARASHRAARFYAAAFFAQQAAEKALLRRPYIGHSLVPCPPSALPTPCSGPARNRQANPPFPDTRMQRWACQRGTPLRHRRSTTSGWRRRWSAGSASAFRAREVPAGSGHAHPHRAGGLLRQPGPGRRLGHSDYDLILVSPDFEGQPLHARAAPFHRMWREPRGLDLLCYTPDEFERKRRGANIVTTALAEGTEVAA